MGDFEIDTRVTGGDGRYRATLSDDWHIWGPNGGYLATIALRAAGAEARVARPASFHGHFLSIARFEAVELAVTAVKRGRRSESFRVSMEQRGRPILEALVRTAAEGPGLDHDHSEAPEVPGPEALEDVLTLRERHGLGDQPRHVFWRNFEARPVWPERVAEGPRPRAPLWREWYRFVPRATFDDPWTDAGRSLLILDTLTWPAAAQPHPDSGFTAPNLDVTAWFHAAVPDEPWLLADIRCPVAAGGLMGTQGRVWSPDRRLVASGGAQLYCVPAPPAA